jgi:pSer/pThr/pTyr-binding forkhead associated (FHA) protein
MGTQPIKVTDTVLVGRGRGLVGIVLDHPTVELRHAKLTPRGGQLIVSDLRSTYGTFVDGERVRRDRPLA